MEGGKGVQTRTLELLKRLSRELSDLDLGALIDEVEGAIEPAEFLRRYVGPNKPLIVRGGARHWPAVGRWDRRYLAETAGHETVTVAFTPNGLADAVTAAPLGGPEPLCFCEPHQRRMLFSEFIDAFFDSRRRWLAWRQKQQQQQQQQKPQQQQQQPQQQPGEEEGDPPDVPYLQAQNGSLTDEMPSLLGDVEEQLPWARAAFGVAPDAVNIFIGDERSQTTFHKDHYENIYAVVAGVKVFHLLPPCDAWRLGGASLPAATYAPCGAGGRLQPVVDTCKRRVTWSAVDPHPDDPAAAAARFPHFWDPSLPRPLVAELRAGDVLYLPAMWHHYVDQRPDEGCAEPWVIAVNAWTDMSWGAGYAHFKLVEALAADAGLLPAPQEDSGSGGGECGADGGSSTSTSGDGSGSSAT
ncbi:hypothetical protein Rsub_12529 [Raphidocelis subcapitata]|uniref:JmjC domain-containing protein n=1 Tax=Raphidocelis subcapitata TaxID=307507 RepID=A0A2V0PIW3_9CHLO|nr:hypothetical protein Rsub_12529 [Raphidocelis subcapitata]|eukprot:GBF99754.1 hypothetical protein Rsub_12529 [Raphidocelis subcapitata]